MKFLLDAQMPPRPAEHFRAARHECEHMRDHLPTNADDRDVAAAANEIGAVLITRDMDFVDLSQRRILNQFLLKTGNMSRRRTVETLLPALQGIIAAIEAGDRIVEFR